MFLLTPESERWNFHLLPSELGSATFAKMTRVLKCVYELEIEFCSELDDEGKTLQFLL